MKIVISSGHGKYISGAVGYIHEHQEAVRVVNEVARNLRSLGVDVVTFEDTTSKNQDQNLATIVNFHNAQGPHDYDVSVHFNANGTTNDPLGTECWYMTQEELAAQIATAIADASGLIDRGSKHSSGLYFLKNTREKSVLIETCFVTSRADTDIYKNSAKFTAICAGIAEALSGQRVQPGPTPPPIDPPVPPDVAGHPTLKKGSTGPEVVRLQQVLGVLKPDGDFGPTTETWVKAFQGANNLGKDGVVGQQTWGAVDALEVRVTMSRPPLPQALADQIYTMAQQSEIADFAWPDRGVAQPGYIPGMALSFAYAMNTAGSASAIMCRAQGDPDTDALAWYEPEFRALGMRNDGGIDTLRHLFVMAVGLGPRESSGCYCEGRDLSASNVESDTAEAGLFQTSWNIRSASGAIGPLLTEFWNEPEGFLSEFKEGITATANNLDSYGSGDGLRYQWLSRFCPLFHVMVTGVGMRTLRAHWGPIGRREVTLKREADNLLKEVQALVEASV